jgi:NAD(P)-dependent dehydrogenase (short-subunit alcohol dehydrogenase family)
MSDPGPSLRPADLFDLSGRVALVTGGSRGIGKEVVRGFAAAGADVVIASRKLDACEALAAEIRETTGRRALPVAANVSVWEDCDRLVDTVYAEMGTCDVLVNNAGSSPLYPDLVSITKEYYDKVHGLNARGPFRLSALIGTRMYEGDGGSIINVSTIGSLHAGANELIYSMAKAGMNQLTQGLVSAFAPKVRANTVLPGSFATDVALQAYWLTEGQEQLARIGQPTEMVGICVYLASDAASYTNGATIEVSKEGWRRAGRG